MPDLDLFDRAEIWLTEVTARGVHLPDIGTRVGTIAPPTSLARRGLA